MATLRERAEESHQEYQKINRSRKPGKTFRHINVVVETVGVELFEGWQDSLTASEKFCVETYIESYYNY